MFEDIRYDKHSITGVSSLQNERHLAPSKSNEATLLEIGTLRRSDQDP